MVFGHLPNPLETMRRLYQALRKGGTMWIEFKLHGIGSLENKFYDGSNPDQIGLQAQKVVDDLKSSGIDVEVTEDVIIIKKNDVKIRFPSVKISPGVREEDGRFNMYTLKREKRPKKTALLALFLAIFARYST
jgi:hypothetical protein